MYDRTTFGFAYTEAERAAVIQQGKENPRKLSLEEERLARRNRALFKDQPVHWGTTDEEEA
jgi:hypothetical protein